MGKAILFSLLLFVACVASGVSLLRAERKNEELNTQFNHLRYRAKESFSGLKSDYDSRLELLGDVDAKFAKEMRAKAIAVRLDNNESLDQYTLFQKEISERLAQWMETPAAGKSPLAEKLRNIESDLEQKRADYTRIAFEANRILETNHLADAPLAIFKAVQEIKPVAAK